MRLVYGSPLPPGVESSTRGELRIRVEKLLIKDGLVHTNIASTVSAAGPRPYTIPVDECAVSALFWGEQQSSSHCIPATPAKPRGAVSLVYPIKTYEQQFSHYLTHMSSSAQKGVELAVFVPTSYSGRHKPVSVGKAIVLLDSLKPSTPISGWFAVMSSEVRSMDAVGKDNGESHKEEEREKEKEKGELIEVGKLKLTFTITFFTRAPQSPRRPAARSTSVSSYEKHQTLEEKKRERSQSREDGIVKEPHYTGRSSTLVNPDITVIMDATQTQIAEQEEQKLQSQPKESVDNFAINNSIGAPVTGMRESKKYSSIQQDSGGSKITQDPKGSTLPYTSVTPTVELNQKNAIVQLIQKGLSLREKMSKALLPYTDSENLSISTRQPLTLSSPTTLRTVPNYLPTTLPAEHIMNNIPISSDALESSVSSANDESIDSKTDEDMNVKTTPFSKDQEGYVMNQTEKYSFKTPYQPSGLNINENAYVEVDISKIAFSSGRATLGMEEMRVGIRLSKDVKTDEPVESYSSYVHRVPLTRGANHHIVIGFPIRSFSKDKSRMVISFYRVRSAPVANPPGELLLPPPASAQRVLVEETLLGMCIIGLHDQSRDVVLHDPITGEDPTQAFVQVSLRNSDKQLLEGERVKDHLLEKKIQQQRNMEGRGRHENKVIHNIEGRMKSVNALKEQHDHNNLGSQTRKGRKHHRHSSRNSLSSSSTSSVSTQASSTCSSVDSTPLLVPSGNGTQEGKNKRVSGIVPDSNNISISPPHPISSSDVVKQESFLREGVKIAASDSAPAAAAAADIDNDNNVYPVMTAAAADYHSPNHNNENDNREEEKYSVRCNNPTTVASGNCGMNAEKHARLVDADTSMLPTMHKAGDGNLPDRFRMHVSIRAGKELPMVTVNPSGSPSLPTVAAIDQLDNGVRSAVTSDGRLVLVDSKYRVFQPPTTFFVVEDIYSGADSRAASKGVVPDWFVEAAVHGEYDRTCIVPQSQSPQFDYECILSLPWESVFLRQAPKKSKDVSGETMQLVPEGSTSPLTCATIANSACTMNTTSITSITNNTSNTASTLCLQEMRLTLWHAVMDGNKTTSSDLNKNEEEKFWESTAILGECRVDLRSLRFLKVLDGWYRINAIDRVDEVVGYVRVSVRLL
ncbi:hypothetical protein LSM04_006587 [Trypanosoma melophagium]|uniref:uncharacterized protein n=1 Tax=Trypanosoma melophagium TaxID=715481 RepID=UPI00351A3E92|nr:hypothetical protein LSM04_006587 [Trypanosoma melophagium]